MLLILSWLAGKESQHRGDGDGILSSVSTAIVVVVLGDDDDIMRTLVSAKSSILCWILKNSDWDRDTVPSSSGFIQITKLRLVCESWPYSKAHPGRRFAV